jgi:hypothetical protein
MVMMMDVVRDGIRNKIVQGPRCDLVVTRTHGDHLWPEWMPEISGGECDTHEHVMLVGMVEREGR